MDCLLGNSRICFCSILIDFSFKAQCKSLTRSIDFQLTHFVYTKSISFSVFSGIMCNQIRTQWGESFWWANSSNFCSFRLCPKRPMEHRIAEKLKTTSWRFFEPVLFLKLFKNKFKKLRVLDSWNKIENETIQKSFNC